MSDAEDKRLHLFASPLKHKKGENARQASVDVETKFDEHGLRRVTAYEGEVPAERQLSEQPSYIDTDGPLHENPEYHRHVEATSGELFYDLFFVANLTTFTNTHEINSTTALASYVGFFVVLWFTWYQVSLYDVRFSVDSVFDRVCKTLQFGVMTGFAVTGPQFEPDYIHFFRAAFRTFALLLMASRFVLCIQYGHALFFLRDYRSGRLPLFILIAMEFIAAWCYLGVFFTFPRSSTGGSSHAYIAFYIVGVAETLVNTTVSCTWRIISFKGTHLVQRMSLLTLIILGEGVIGITKSIAKMIINDGWFSAATRSNLSCAVLIIYCLFMIYFDRIRDSHFGTVRQQIWAFLHFPLHVALVLTNEGISQFILWRHAFENLYLFRDLLNDIDTNFDDRPRDAAYFSNLTDHLNETAYVFIDAAPLTVNLGDAVDELETTLLEIKNGSELTGNGTNFNPAPLDNDFSEYVTVVMNIILNSIGLEGESSTISLAGVSSADAEFEANQHLFELVFLYLFIAGGLALIVMGTMAWVSRPPRNWRQWLRGSINFAVGLGVCLLALMDLTTPGDRFATSPWVIPTLFFAYAVVLVGDHMPLHKFWVRR